MKFKDFIKVSSPERSIDNPGEIILTVKIDTFEQNLNNLQPVMIGISEAIKEYVKENKAKEIFDALKPIINKQISETVEKEIEARAMRIISEMDIKGLVNLFTIGLARKISERMY